MNLNALETQWRVDQANSQQVADRARQRGDSVKAEAFTNTWQTLKRCADELGPAIEEQEATLAARDAALQDARYEAKLFSENYTRDYEREKQRAAAAERALSDTVQALQTLETTWRGYHWHTGECDECADDLARLLASLAPQEPGK